MLSLFLPVLLATTALAAPAAVVVSNATTLISRAATTLVSRDVTTLTADAIAGFAPYTEFAAAAYCPQGIETWQCGDSCTANGDFELYGYGGDGGDVQYYYLGYSPSLQTIIVAHQGTDPTELESVLTDVDFPQDSLDATLFPGAPTDALVHGGFRDAQADTADIVLAGVRALMASSGTSSVTAVGHSLGGAIAEMDAVFLKLNIPEAVVNAVTFGKPRVGNPAWAELVDASVDSFRRVNNMDDLVPILPGRGLGFAHPEGEVHIVQEGEWVACPGNDDADDEECTIQTVPNIFEGNVLDHLGPYAGIYISTITC
ncbi:Alpha/Beta hydrolase protein [Schizophyllum amplum]|uniref:Alpha/Beta hydrolase protein n=1 Tax=Schizophyllum amplum TaxID=97359 RepID=A0A550C122_9AGAR|nr:Alpha/Beta hydrolase protein [Auriculariopsis ampla]